MDSYDSYRHHSNPTLSSRQQGHQAYPRPIVASSDQGASQQSQQQLPSFKEVCADSWSFRGKSDSHLDQILPPPLHSAIDSATQSFILADLSTTSNQQYSRPGGSRLPSPNYSQSSSMLDSFDDFGPRSHEPISQVSITHRHPSFLTSNSQISEMAASYTQRIPYHTQQFSGRHSPNLPPIRDIDQGINKFNGYDTGYMATNGGYPATYNQNVSATSHYSGDVFQIRRNASVYDNNPRMSQTYPPANRAYPQLKPEYPNYTHQPYEPYVNRPTFSDFHYSPPPGGPPGGVQYPIGETADSRNRRRRGNLPKHITDILRAWFQDHLDHPYPSEEEKQMFIQQTGLTMNQISNWFINYRRRHLPALRQARDGRNQGLDTESHRQSR